MRQYLVLSDSPWKSVPTRTQQLVTRLKDAQVLFFEPAHGDGKGHRAEGRQVRPNVTVYTRPPMAPLPEGATLLRRRSWRRQADFITKAAARHRFREPALWCCSPEQVRLLEHLAHRGLIYDCDRDWSDLPPEWEGELASVADVVFAASPWLVERLSPCSSNVTLLPNGVNFPMFSRSGLDLPQDLAGLRGPVLGFVGAVGPDLDLAPVEYAASVHPDWTFVLVGRVGENPRLGYLRELPNVLTLGHRPMVDIPDYLGRFDVCLDLRRAREQIDDVIPRRIYEYLSTGKPIVTLLFPDQVEEFPDVIYGAHSLEEYERMCRSALTEDRTWVTDRRRNYGAAAAWSRRAEEIQRILGAIGLY